MLQKINRQNEQQNSLKQEIESIKQQVRKMNDQQNKLMIGAREKKSLIEIDIEESNTLVSKFVEKIQLLEDFIQTIDSNKETTILEKKRPHDEKRSDAHMNSHHSQNDKDANIPGAQEPGAVGYDNQSFKYRTGEQNNGVEMNKVENMHLHNIEKQNELEIRYQLVNHMHRLDLLNGELYQCKQNMELLETKIAQLKSRSSNLVESLSEPTSILAFLDVNWCRAWLPNIK